MRFRSRLFPTFNTYSIGEAISASLTDTDAPGIAEDARSIASNTAECLGGLIQLLFEANILTREQVLTVLSYRWEEVPAEELAYLIATGKETHDA